MVKPCPTCEHTGPLTALAGSMDLLQDIARTRTANVWDMAAKATRAATERLQPESDALPDERARIDQQLEHVFSETSRVTRVAGEMIDLIGNTLQETDEINCAAAGVSGNRCPKLLALVAANPRIQELVQEVQSSEIE